MVIPTSASVTNRRYPELRDEDFNRIVKRVRYGTGISLQEHKKAMVGARVSKRLQALKCGSFREYLDFLETEEGAGEITFFWNSITTNLTSFFRELHHFDHLNRELDRNASTLPRRIRIWSAGCSTGEEAYSAALTLRSHALARHHENLKILATDIDTNVLEQAKQGVFSRNSISSFPTSVDMSFLEDRSPTTFGFARSLMNDISFRRLNLLEDWPFDGPFDAVFCRNVLIYFDDVVKKELIERFCDKLRPGGLLYLGHSETILGAHPRLVCVGTTTYRKRG